MEFCERCVLVHFLADLLLRHALELRVEPEVLLHAQPVEEHVVLWTHAQVLADLVHLRADVVPVDSGRARSRGEQSGQDGPGAPRDEPSNKRMRRKDRTTETTGDTEDEQ